MKYDKSSFCSFNAVAVTERHCIQSLKNLSLALQRFLKLTWYYQRNLAWVAWVRGQRGFIKLWRGLRFWRGWCGWRGSLKLWRRWRGRRGPIKFWHGSKTTFFTFRFFSIHGKYSLYDSFLTFVSLHSLCSFHIQFGVGLKLQTLVLSNILFINKIKSIVF